MADDPRVVFGGLVASAVLKYAGFFLIRSTRNHSYEKVGTVAELYVYPIKSFRGLKVDEAECTSVGLKAHGVYDRSWAAATKDGVYITQRQEPTMALIQTSVHGSHMTLEAPGMSPLTLPIDPDLSSTPHSKITVKVDTVETLDCGDEASRWLCRYFKRDGLRLHFSHPSLEKRDSSKAKKPWTHPALPGDMTSLSDYCSYMVLTNASLRDLNARLVNPVPILNFRGNIVVEGCPAYDEDTWRELKIGEARLRTLDACTRCLLTTVDQFKGVKDPKEEPLATLKKYRLRDPYGPKPAFGVNAALDSPGVIRVGDPIYVLRK